MTQRNAIGSIHSVESILGREMVNCTLKSQVRRWVPISQVMDLPRAAAVLATWMRGNKPDDPRFIPVSKAVAQRNLENRVQAVLDSRLEKVKSLSQSRRGSPAKPMRDGPKAKNSTPQGQNPGSGDNNNNNKNSSNNNNTDVNNNNTADSNNNNFVDNNNNTGDTDNSKDVDNHADADNSLAGFVTPCQNAGRKPDAAKQKAKAAPGQSRKEFGNARCKELTAQMVEMMRSEDLSQESSQELTLSDEAVNQQAAMAAAKIIMEANKESAETAAAEAKIIELESAIADAVGDAAVVPSPKRGDNVAQGAAAEADAVATSELQSTLNLLESARLEEAGDARSLEDHWARIAVHQDDARAVPARVNSSLPAPSMGDGVSSGVRNLFSDASVGQTAAQWQKALMDEMRDLKDKMSRLQQNAAGGGSSELESHVDQARAALLKRINAVVTVDAANHTKAWESLRSCVDPNCSIIGQVGNRWCRCGKPRSCLDLKCHITGCGARLIGSIDDCLAQEDCLACFNKLIHSYLLKTERAKALQALALVPKIKFDSEPIDKLLKVLTNKQHKISEMEDAITILTRLSNPESNFVVGQGLQTVKLITTAVLNGCTQ